MVNCLCWASTYRNPHCHVGCDKRQRPPDPTKRWLTFLRNHREAIAAMDFFTVPTLTFGVLYCFFVISRDRRRILHCNVTRNPAALWIHEVWECGEQPRRFLIFDRDSKFSVDVLSTVRRWASGHCERHSAVHGRTELLNALWAVYAASSWIM